MILPKVFTRICIAALLVSCFQPIKYIVQRDERIATTTAITEDTENVRIQYEEYSARFDAITSRDEISEKGFEIVESQIFPFEPEVKSDVNADIYTTTETENEEVLPTPDTEIDKASSGMSVIPAFDKIYHRLALFLSDADGNILYKTDQLATNYRMVGQMEQSGQEIASIAFQDLNKDARTDIILITSCQYESKQYKVGDVLFQSEDAFCFYRDYRISDKINRFGMNKNAKAIAAFVRDGRSTEFLYTAVTLKELQQNGFQVIKEQSYNRTFSKLGKLQVIPGTYHIADYDVFLIYLVNEKGDILSALYPMGDYDNLYALRGINCRDIDGDGLKDIVVLAKYSYENEDHQLAVESDYSIYYQRTGGFSADTEIKSQYQCSDEDTMQTLVEQARVYWGWETEDD